MVVDSSTRTHLPARKTASSELDKDRY
jgi:hypothetical protein